MEIIIVIVVAILIIGTLKGGNSAKRSRDVADSISAGGVMYEVGKEVFKNKTGIVNRPF
jgi:hypothetical protein